jgi:hypothetical protein
VAQFAFQSTAVEHHQFALVFGQLILELFELHVGNTESPGDVAFVVFLAFGSRVDQHHVGALVDL